MIRRQLTLSLDSPTKARDGASSANSFLKPPMLRRNTDKNFIPEKDRRRQSYLINSEQKNNEQQEENFLNSFGSRNVLNQEKKEASSSSPTMPSPVVLSPMTISRCICVLIQKLMISSQQVECQTLTSDPSPASSFPSVSQSGQFNSESYAVFSRSYVSQKPKQHQQYHQYAQGLGQGSGQGPGQGPGYDGTQSQFSPQGGPSAQLSKSMSRTPPPELSHLPKGSSFSSIQSKGDDLSETNLSSRGGLRFFSRSGRSSNSVGGSNPSLSKSPSRIRGLLSPAKSSSRTVKVRQPLLIALVL
jgi:hypothetical protein